VLGESLNANLIICSILIRWKSKIVAAKMTQKKAA
jgi:hypothetical protein